MTLLEQLAESFSRFNTACSCHTWVIGMDANVRPKGFEDGGFVETATWPLAKAHSSADAALTILLSLHLRVENTWTDERTADQERLK